MSRRNPCLKYNISPMYAVGRLLTDCIPLWLFPLLGDWEVYQVKEPAICQCHNKLQHKTHVTWIWQTTQALWRAVLPMDTFMSRQQNEHMFENERSTPSSVQMATLWHTSSTISLQSLSIKSATTNPTEENNKPCLQLPANYTWLL